MRWLLILLSPLIYAIEPTLVDIPYAQTKDFRQTLNVYSPTKSKTPAPIVFWIHGGGWQKGEKTDVQIKPQFFTDCGYVFVSTNHRYVTAVPMSEILADIAKALRWTYDHAQEFNADPTRIVIMGHSSGAQLAALIAIDERYLKAEGLDLKIFKACLPVDADTFDIPLIIETATANRKAAGKPEPQFGHREIFGGTVEQWNNYSCTAQIKPDKNIPPFLIMHVGTTATTTAQAQRLAAVLTSSKISAQILSISPSDHGQINAQIGDPAATQTQEIKNFLEKF